jgi:small subunit ribosomal protein S8
MGDPISDMFCQIKNAQMVKKEEVLIPYSKFKHNLLKVLQKEGLIGEVKKVKKRIKKRMRSPKPFLKVKLKYDENNQPMITKIKMISKPGQRIYSSSKDLIKYESKGIGIVLVSTPKGVMTSREARKRNLGGEVICKIL